MTTAIHLQDVVKAYRLGSRHGSIKERVLRGRSVDAQGIFRALDNVDLEVRPGEILGILGDNGSGKSTLLKLVAGITEPTSGTVTVHGTVASLLEVGVGFHLEMTGYENVRLSGALLGMDPEKLEARIPEIVAFAELEGFMETPVKHYSSGMFLRLGFAIGAFVDPDVILVDEVLAVGDQLFQRKCDDHLRRLQASGSTVVVVSHNLHTIQSLCTRCVVLDRGKVLGQGTPIDMVALYRQHLFVEARARGQHPPAEVTLWNRYGRFEARIERVEMRGTSGEPGVVFETGDSLTVDVHWTADRPLVYPAFAFSILDDDEREVYTTGTHIVLPDVPEMEGRGVVRFEVRNLNLLEGYYSLQLGIAERPDGPGSTVDFYQGQDFQRAVEPFMVRSHQVKKGVTGITDLDLHCAFLPADL